MIDKILIKIHNAFASTRKGKELGLKRIKTK